MAPFGKSRAAQEGRKGLIERLGNIALWVRDSTESYEHHEPAVYDIHYGHPAQWKGQSGSPSPISSSTSDAFAAFTTATYTVTKPSTIERSTATLAFGGPTSFNTPSASLQTPPSVWLTPIAIPTLATSAGVKGIINDDKDFGTRTAIVQINSSTTFSATAAAETIDVTNADGLQAVESQNTPLSATSRKIIIAAGTVGAVIVVALLMYLVLRFTNPNIWSNLRSKITPQSWRSPGRPRRSTYAKELASPTFQKDKKDEWERKMDVDFTPMNMPVKSKPIATIEELDRAEEERQNLVRDIPRPGLGQSVIAIPAFAKSPLDSQTSRLEATTVYYGTANPQSSDEWPASPERPPVQQASNVYYPNSRISDMSSLSSGFGDAQIDVPESGPSLPGTLRSQHKSVAYRMSQNKDNFNSRFSRASASTVERRDTIYTTSSVDSVPRFRTVHSWVNQQSKSIMRRKESDVEVASMPSLAGDQLSAMPTPLQPATTRQTAHQRGLSEVTNPAFKAHPGDEVVVGGGSRVASMILDRKMGR